MNFIDSVATHLYSEFISLNIVILFDVFFLFLQVRGEIKTITKVVPAAFSFCASIDNLRWKTGNTLGHKLELRQQCSLHQM